MMQPLTMLGAGLCLGVLFLRYRSRRKDGPGRKPKKRRKTVKVLLAAFVAWMALFYTLQHTIGNLDGAAPQEPSLMERMVSYLSK